MFKRRLLGLAVPVAGMLASLTCTGAAHAAVLNPLSCSASAVRVTALTGTVDLEPETAGGSPCVTDSNQAANLNANLGSLSGLGLSGSLTTGAVQVNTVSVNTGGNVSALATAQVAGLNIPTPAGNITMNNAAQSSASYACVNGEMQPTVGSTLTSLTIGSQTINLPTTGATDSIPLTLLGVNIGTVSVDNETQTADSVSMQLLNVDLLGAADIVVGESVATESSPGYQCPTDTTGDPTTTTSTTTTTNKGGKTVTGPTDTTTTSTDPTDTTSTTTSTTTTKSSNSTSVDNDGCPVGTTLINGTECAINTSSTTATSTVTSSSSSTTVAVTTINSGNIVGGRIVTLRYARRHWRGNACLRGSGPKWVVIGNGRANKIRVRNGTYRVLGRGGRDRITVTHAPRTCVSGGAGRDRIVANQSKLVALYGNGGADVLINRGGRAADLFGGAGNDRLFTSKGSLAGLFGGAGNDVLAGLGKHVAFYGGRGRNRILRGHAATAVLRKV